MEISCLRLFIYFSQENKYYIHLYLVIRFSHQIYNTALHKCRWLGRTWAVTGLNDGFRGQAMSSQVGTHKHLPGPCICRKKHTKNLWIYNCKPDYYYMLQLEISFGTITINPGSIRLWQDSTLDSQNTPLNFIFLWSKVFQYWHQVDAKSTKVGVLAPYMMLWFNQGANHKNPKINTPLKILCTNHIMKKIVAPAEGKKLLQFRYKGYATQDISACQEPTTYRHIGN